MGRFHLQSYDIMGEKYSRPFRKCLSKNKLKNKNIIQYSKYKSGRNTSGGNFDATTDDMESTFIEKQALKCAIEIQQPVCDANSDEKLKVMKALLQDIKKKKIRYATFLIENETRIVKEKIGERNALFKDFQKDITCGGENACRYGLYDFEYSQQLQGTIDLNKKDKVVLICYCPDTASTRN